MERGVLWTVIMWPGAVSSLHLAIKSECNILDMVYLPIGLFLFTTGNLELSTISGGKTGDIDHISSISSYELNTNTLG